jgi:hypothetical protein
MKPDSSVSSSKTAIIQSRFAGLVGLQLFKAWNVFATRMFYFATRSAEARGNDGEYVLTLECPWRIEEADHILVGSEDYGVRAGGNTDEAWEPDMQWGQLQDQKLRELLGKEEDGAIVSTRSDLIVESVEPDSGGGFRLHLSGAYTLAVFPTTDSDMEWLLRQRGGGYLILMNGDVQGSLI